MSDFASAISPFRGFKSQRCRCQIDSHLKSEFLLILSSYIEISLRLVEVETFVLVNCNQMNFTATVSNQTISLVSRKQYVFYMESFIETKKPLKVQFADHQN